MSWPKCRVRTREGKIVGGDLRAYDVEADAYVVSFTSVEDSCEIRDWYSKWPPPPDFEEDYRRYQMQVTYRFPKSAFVSINYEALGCFGPIVKAVTVDGYGANAKAAELLSKGFK
jgi:hypothetical protein